MIENLFTSKTRIKLLKLFLSNPDKRYYLRGLEKELGESLTPLRRELLRLTNMGILSMQEEANLKYYKLNKDFSRVEELKNLVLGKDKSLINQATTERESLINQATTDRGVVAQFIGQKNVSLINQATTFVMAVLLIVLIAFLIWTNSKNIQNLAKAISPKTQGSIFEAKTQTPESGAMKSGRWKILPGNWPLLGGEEAKNSKEL